MFYVIQYGLFQGFWLLVTISGCGQPCSTLLPSQDNVAAQAQTAPRQNTPQTSCGGSCFWTDASERGGGAAKGLLCGVRVLWKALRKLGLSSHRDHGALEKTGRGTGEHGERRRGKGWGCGRRLQSSGSGVWQETPSVACCRVLANIVVKPTMLHRPGQRPDNITRIVWAPRAWAAVLEWRF